MNTRRKLRSKTVNEQTKKKANQEKKLTHDPQSSDLSQPELTQSNSDSEAEAAAFPKRSEKDFTTLRESVQTTTAFLKDLNQSLKTEEPLIIEPVGTRQLEIMARPQPPAFNKDMAELMTANIPKFELNIESNAALDLRAFLKSCKNVLSLFGDNDQDIRNEFFRLIKFRLGYNVLERITKENFADLQDLETHLRTVCHIKLNKGNLLAEIRNEKQHNNEDVSHFVERLRKLIAQGRAEYANNGDFEVEAVRTLKNSIKNELISIKLMDSNAQNFEELAELAINRDSELNQRAHKITNKPEDKQTSELLQTLLQKIKLLEESKEVTVQHIRQENRFRSNSPNNNYNFKRSESKSPVRNNKLCHYCKKPGHFISECRRRSQFNQNPPQATNYGNYQTTGISNNQNPINPRSQHQGFPPPVRCVRCNQEGHKSTHCYAIICSNCKQIGHAYTQCQQSTTTRRVHFLDSEETCTCSRGHNSAGRTNQEDSYQNDSHQGSNEHEFPGND